MIKLGIPESRALVTIPAGDLGEGIHGGLQTSLHQLLEGVLGQVAGSSVGVTAVLKTRTWFPISNMAVAIWEIQNGGDHKGNSK